MNRYLKKSILIVFVILVIQCILNQYYNRTSNKETLLFNDESFIEKQNNMEIKSLTNHTRRKKSTKWACFLTSEDYYNQKINETFDPRDLRLFSCAFNIDPFEINETEILVIGSKKKVGSILTDLLKQSQIKYGRIKNRYHLNMTNEDIISLVTLLNFKTIIDLSNDVKINEIIEYQFKEKKIELIRTFQFKSKETDKIPNYEGTTIITDKIFNPIFYPNSIHSRETSDLNYYLFDKYFLNSLHDSNTLFDKEQKYSSAKEIANLIFNLIKKKEISASKLIDIRSNSKSAEEIIQKVENSQNENNKNSDPFEYSISEITNHYKSVVDSSVITKDTDYIYTSHVTIVSNNNQIMKRYKAVCKLVNEALELFYGMMSVEFICVTEIQPNRYSKFEWIQKLNEFKKHHVLISIPLTLLASIKKQYNIYYFPEYFLRNIGLRRAKGRYMLSGSSDVIMPPHFFLGIQKHLFSKNYLLRTIRNNIYSNSAESSLTFASLFKSYIKGSFFRNKIVNTEFPNKCNMPCNPRNRDCGDFQGFHRNFWYKMNAYYNGYENYNVDSFLSYHLLGFFTPIMYKLMFGEQHIFHSKISSSTPELQNSVYCNYANIKRGIFKPPMDGTPDWGYPNELIPITFSYKL